MLSQIKPIERLSVPYQADLTLAANFIYNHLDKVWNRSSKDWVDRQLSIFQENITKRSFFLAFSSVTRHLDRGLLPVSQESRKKAEETRKGWQPWTYTIDQACRILFLLYIPHENADIFTDWLSDIFDTADLGEQVALYGGLPLYPFPEKHVHFTAEGIRTNMTSVLEAVALHNPYPSEFLAEGAWNQLYLKCCFTDRPLYRIQGIDQRANKELARIISDYAHERWSAGRIVSPEFWRPVSSFIDDALLEDIKKLFNQKDDLQQLAAALVCYHSENQKAQDILSQYPAWQKKVESGEVNWVTLGQRWEERK